MRIDQVLLQTWEGCVHVDSGRPDLPPSATYPPPQASRVCTHTSYLCGAFSDARELLSTTNSASGNAPAGSSSVSSRWEA
jgi:hypothetical protein